MAESTSVQDLPVAAGKIADDASGHETIILGLLSAVDRDSRITQRSLSRELGIALGLANACLKRCVRKGLIKVSQAPLNRYAYYLTPTGFAEKSRLTVEFLKSSFDFFRSARSQLGVILDDCRAAGFEHVALIGAGDLAEAAILSAAERGFGLVAVVDSDWPAPSCAGLAVVASLDQASGRAPGGALDALILTDLEAPQATFERLLAQAVAAGLAPERVFAPALLNISRTPPASAPSGAGR